MNVTNLMWLVTKAFAEGADAAVADEAAAMESVSLFSMGGQLLIMLGLLALMYFMMIRPQRKKDKKVKEMLANLKVGDRVTTIGGINGTIMGIKDETVTLGVGAEKVKLIMERWAIRSVEEVSLENDSEQLV